MSLELTRSNSVEFRPRPTRSNMVEFRPRPTQPNMIEFRLRLTWPNFGRNRFIQISIGTNTTEF